MIRNQKFKLSGKHNCSSWKTFEDAYQYFKAHKDTVEKTFADAIFDHNLEEPMNYLVLECDRRNPQSQVIQTYANKLNELFNNSEKIVIDTRITEIPPRYRGFVHTDHTWFIKEKI